MALLGTLPLALLLAAPEAPAPDPAEDPALAETINAMVASAERQENENAPPHILTPTLPPKQIRKPKPAPNPETDAAEAEATEAEATAQAITAMVASADRQMREQAQYDADNPPIDWSDPDPFEPVNRVFYAINKPIDALILRPAALVYQTVMPKPLRDGIHNALGNIFIPTVLANDILQLRPRRAARTLARFVINSTLGIGGLFDVARRKPFRIEGHANSASDTLGVAGMEDGAYLYLPLLGPTTFRDMIGMVGDAFTQPLLLDRVSHQQVHTVNKRKRILVSETFTVSTQGLAILLAGGLDARARAEPDLHALKKQSVDPYAALRSSYLQNRAGDIARLKAKDGQPAKLPALDDPLSDPAASPAP